ncbi:hypothetical protein [Streptomyces agglomeratus]|nr:hypothetical protein [Streptomyces agglomeratus]
MAWLAGCRRLHRRYERKVEHFLAFTSRFSDRPGAVCCQPSCNCLVGA